MTVATRTFQSIQPKTPLEDQKSRVPINQALQYLSGALQADIDTAIAAAIAANTAALPTFSAHKNGVNQGSISSSSTPITFSTEAWDVGGYFASDAWMPPAGKYRITAHVRFDSTNAVDNEALILEVFKAGALYRRAITVRGGAATLQDCEVSVLAEANGTDAFDIRAAKNGAGVGAIDGAAPLTWFEGECIA